MALSDAVLEIADQIDLEIKDLEGFPVADWRASLRGFVRQLRSVVKAAERDEEDSLPENPLAGFLVPEYQNNMMVEKAREEMRALRRKTDAAENVGQTGGLIAECIGGPMDGTFTPIEPEMPIGAMTLLEGRVYLFTEDRKFHYNEEVTRKEYEKRGKLAEYKPWQSTSKIIIP